MLDNVLAATKGAGADKRCANGWQSLVLAVRLPVVLVTEPSLPPRYCDSIPAGVRLGLGPRDLLEMVTGSGKYACLTGNKLLGVQTDIDGLREKAVLLFL